MIKYQLYDNIKIWQDLFNLYLLTGVFTTVFFNRQNFFKIYLHIR